MLSPLQTRILQFISDRTATTGRSPSIRQIARAVGRSAASVHAQMKSLEDGGYLWRVSDRPPIVKVNFDRVWAQPSHSRSAGTAQGEEPAAPLTTRQQRILQVIHDTVVERGYPPSIREIGEAVGLTSSSSVHAQLEALQRKGYIRRDTNRPTAIEVHLEGAPLAGPRPLPTYIPVVGQVMAGMPILAEEQVEGVFPLPRELVGEGQLFILRVHGDSMVEAGVFDGDYVVVRSQPSAEDGDMVAAMLHDQEAEATIKYLSRKAGRVQLFPANQAFEPIPGDQATILGRVVAVLRRL